MAIDSLIINAAPLVPEVRVFGLLQVSRNMLPKVTRSFANGTFVLEKKKQRSSLLTPLRRKILSLRRAPFFRI